MSKMITTARMRPDGTVVVLRDDGKETTIEKTPMPPMTEAEIEAAVAADSDAQPMTATEMNNVHRVPRTRTLRRALALTQEEFAMRYCSDNE